MMIMRRRKGEKILIGDNIVIHISQIGRNKVKMAIQAPREILVIAEELQRVSLENTAAASASASDVMTVLSCFQDRSAA